MVVLCAQFALRTVLTAGITKLHAQMLLGSGEVLLHRQPDVSSWADDTSLQSLVLLTMPTAGLTNECLRQSVSGTRH